MSSSPPGNPNIDLSGQRLAHSDAQALDMLVEGGFDTQRGSDDSPRLTRLRSLLRLLDTPMPTGQRPGSEGANSPSLLIDVTVARVLRERERNLAGRIRPTTKVPTLAPSAADDLDSLIETGWQDGQRRRSGAAALLSLLTPGPTPSDPDRRETLVQATLGRVQQAIDTSAGRFRMHPVRVGMPARSGWRLTDLAAVAAAAFLAMSVFWPMIAGSREQARRQWCTAGLSAASIGFGMYAADHNSQLPRARPSFYGGTWWDVGTPQRSHSANLYLLVRDGYASLAELACPGNHDAPVQKTPGDEADWRKPEEVSYSFQLFNPGRPGWGSNPGLVILADRSPVVERARLGESANANACSRNHNGRGQNLLFGDGSIRFTFTPVLEGGDNIWLPGRHTNAPARLSGRETPIDDADTFVGP